VCSATGSLGNGLGLPVLVRRTPGPPTAGLSSLTTALGVRSGLAPAAVGTWCGGRTETLAYAPVRSR
jgi:hypothetical protein